MEIKLNISPCPNDTYMFDALANGKIDTLGYTFNLLLADIEELNSLAIKGIPDVSKVSFGVFPQIATDYQLLTVGSALGFGVGPMLISKRAITPDDIQHCTVAIPGQHTTANLLFSMAFPYANKKRFLLFSKIEEAILNNEVDAGVIIHESRFTFQDKGLQKIADLGEWWEHKTGLPVPLGGIAIKRKLPQKTKSDITLLLHQSIQAANLNPSATMGFVQQYAQEMSPSVQRAHIALYVNKHSLQLEKQGQDAIKKLLYANNESHDINNLFVSST